VENGRCTVSTASHLSLRMAVNMLQTPSGVSCWPPVTFGTQDWRPTIGGRNNCLSQTGNWNGSGGSSSIDSVVTRDRDNAAWNAAAPSGTGANTWAIEYSEFVLQNCRADVVRTVSAGGAMGAQIRYTAYGESARFRIYDIAGGGSGLNAPDGNLDGEHYSAFMNAFGAEDALIDFVGGDGNPPGDGNVAGNDFSAYLNAYAASGPAYFSDNRRLYAGYELQDSMRKSAKECYASCADR